VANHEGEKRRCPVLGGEIPHSYCMKADAGGPCQAYEDCWGGPPPATAEDSEEGAGT